MSAALVPLVLLLLGLAVAAWLMTARTRQEAGRTSHLRDPRVPALRYLVSQEQDPAVLVEALSLAGYEAAENPTQVRELLVGATDGGTPDRDRVREVLASVTTTGLEGRTIDPRPVRFEDE